LHNSVISVQLGSVLFSGNSIGNSACEDGDAFDFWTSMLIS
jgi:hypothetical protein